MTTFAEYQASVQRTKPAEHLPILAAFGIAGESGEVVDLIKKHLFHGQPLDTEKLKKELGDVLWYVAYTAELYGLTLEDVAQANIEKLAKRYPNGFSKEAAKARADEK